MITPMLRFLPLAALFALALQACATHRPLHGTEISATQPERAFVLTDQRGRPSTLGGPSGHFTALYFGFTHCADVCPQTLAALANARSRAGIADSQLKIVMVTVDPARDTPKAMRAFLAKLHVRALGLTGSKKQLQHVYRQYGVAVVPEKDDIIHSDDVYLLDRQGRLRELIHASAGAGEIAQDLQTVIG
ncbi:MAG TPA: SCO family protein [Candidatus Baltobacteraceae bacterium]|jgi:protein SCO1/2|nr:SCO family protein [Candidatus Baltobacteraceae bacterium]